MTWALAQRPPNEAMALLESVFRFAPHIRDMRAELSKEVSASVFTDFLVRCDERALESFTFSFFLTFGENLSYALLEKKLNWVRLYNKMVKR